MTKPKGLSPEEEEAWRQRRCEVQRRYHEAHRERERQRFRQRYAADLEKSRERVRQRQDRVRDTVLGHYGRACACCGTTDRPTIDHIDGSGREHRAELFGGRQQAGVPFYDWLILEGFPPGFQTLCHPCNNSKGTREYCRLNHATAAKENAHVR